MWLMRLGIYQTEILMRDKTFRQGVFREKVCCNDFVKVTAAPRWMTVPKYLLTVLAWNDLALLNSEANYKCPTLNSSSKLPAAFLHGNTYINPLTPNDL
jgi:hypothetical protein